VSGTAVEFAARAAYAKFSAPIRAYSITDETYAPLPAVEASIEFYPTAVSKLERVDPAKLGGAPIGHFGFFRERFKDTL
jgi:predicted alpha/beta hydrolase